MKSITFKKSFWAGLLLVLIGVTLIKCNSSGEDDKKPAGATATEAQKRELHQLEQISAMKKYIAELEAQRTASAQLPPLFQTTGVPTQPIAIIPINRYVPAQRNSPQINELRTAIWQLEADMSVARTQRLMGARGGKESDIAWANIRAMDMTLTDMKAELARLQSQ